MKLEGVTEAAYSSTRMKMNRRLKVRQKKKIYE